MVAWNFRAAPGFMDVVTYDGEWRNPNGKKVSHFVGRCTWHDDCLKNK